ncbi:maleylacetate reductase [Ramlibacter sp. 2FC]|uniref:maleylacetate reductase n=1 Tax=Ramlibacter sp. 2FC TaxID=2502188 RepID=UPI0010F8591B|nr:maleylacetate reductase [Ramlibacter sp. 2FC]
MNEFTHEILPSRIVFGTGALGKLPEEVRRLSATRALLLCTPEQQRLAKQVTDLLGPLAVGIFAGAVMHVPAECVERALGEARRHRADVCIAVGGGSTIGLAKAMALVADIRIIAVPTTYAGSEVTPIYGITTDGLKKTGRDVRVLPRTVIYDPDLTLTLPAAISVASGMNAMAHAAEGLYARDRNPVCSLMAEEGLRALARSLPVLATNGADREARASALYGAWLCGSVLGSVGMALHHKLCHTLGGTFNLPHAELHTVMLPHAIGYNEVVASDAAARIASAIGSSRAGAGLQDLARRCGAPLALKDIGMKAEDLPRAADLACQDPYWNPRAFQRSDVLELLQRAFDGVPITA